MESESSPDPSKASVATQLFEWFATGAYRLKTARRQGQNDGLSLGSAKSNKSELHNILRRRLYSGDFDGDGLTYRGTYIPLVTKTV